MVGHTMSFFDSLELSVPGCYSFDLIRVFGWSSKTSLIFHMDFRGHVARPCPSTIIPGSLSALLNDLWPEYIHAPWIHPTCQPLCPCYSCSWGYCPPGIRTNLNPSTEFLMLPQSILGAPPQPGSTASASCRGLHEGQRRSLWDDTPRIPVPLNEK